jgi:hypothetical protein
LLVVAVDGGTVINERRTGRKSNLLFAHRDVLTMAWPYLSDDGFLEEDSEILTDQAEVKLKLGHGKCSDTCHLLEDHVIRPEQLMPIHGRSLAHVALLESERHCGNHRKLANGQIHRKET